MLLKSLGMQVPGGSNPSPSAGQRHVWFLVVDRSRVAAVAREAMQGASARRRRTVAGCGSRSDATPRRGATYKSPGGGGHKAERPSDGGGELVNEVDHGLHDHRGPHTVAELIERWMTPDWRPRLVPLNPGPLPLRHQQRHPPPARHDPVRPADRPTGRRADGPRHRRLLRSVQEAGPRRQHPQVPRHPLRLPPRPLRARATSGSVRAPAQDAAGGERQRSRRPADTIGPRPPRLMVAEQIPGRSHTSYQAE
jgi:hypothetical protein